MYLKKLKLSGFKSFADPVTLEFSKGISAIVGPNGSGKSNITDAIKWVLGEQSIKSLRGKKMEDVIFSGTEKKPASGYAEVVLVLDNNDKTLENYPQEVAISRKLFRTGESDYAINKKSCKLKEVHSIFMDTGLGKNGYSLISQGGIESIIASSPTELRNIFEEAVGIVSYKTKKNEAEKKLDQTQGHLDRLRDIMAEIEKQIGPLKNQSRKAKSWQVLHEELKTVDLVVFHTKMSAAMTELEGLKSKLEQQLKSCESDEKSIAEKDALYQRLTIENRELDLLGDDEKKGLAALKADFDRNQQAEIRSNSQLEANEITQARLTTEWESLTSRIDAMMERIEALATEKDALIKTRVHHEEHHLELEQAFNEVLAAEQQVKERIKAQQDAVLNHQATCDSLAEKRLELRAAIQETKTEETFVKKRLEECGENTALLQAELRRVKADREQQIDALKQQQEQYKNLQSAYNQEVAVQKSWQNEEHLLSNNLRVNASKVDYLKNIQKNYQDYFPTIRKLMTSEKMLGPVIRDVYGPVGELISMDSRYLQAIDIALGAKSQNIVVATVKVASDCINLLKKERLGRATFLPLDNLRYSAVDERTRQLLENLPGVEGIASELVETDAAYRKAVESLLGRVIVASDFATGKEIQKKLASKFTVVTLAGEIFYPGGAIVGGQSKDNRQSPLSKKIEIENLEKEMAEQEKSLSALKIRAQQSHAALAGQAEELKSREGQFNLAKQSLWEKNKLAEDLAQKKSANDQTLRELQERTQLLEQCCQKLEAELAATEKAYSDVKELTRGQNSDENTEAIRLQLDDLRTQISESQMAITRIKGEIAGLDQQLNLMQEQLNQQTDRKTALADEQKGYQQNSTELLEKQKYLAVEIIRLKEMIKTRQDKNRNAQEQQKKNAQRLETLQEEIKNDNHQLIINNDQKNTLTTQINGLQIQMDHWEENMYKSYEMNFLMVTDAYQQLAAAQQLDELDLSEERQRELKGKIAALGNVNLNAIEEYEEILARHDFMKEQLDDLIKAKREILDIINTLQDAMTEQFKNNFIKLQENFTRIFSVLFEGGRAYLEFTDPTEILDGGIEMVAQPPGKRLRHISLLSGGEKSMVAIALLFSFLEINPSPFCVIDEIDAALDDHNIYRYINYLKKIAENNQFIVITHRRTTLEVCDNLYGVSMSQQGVSQLVSVRLTDYA
ncbi:chromosome segregation protein SMC [Acetobacterium fimetarium]|uniref:Chromosome partition protein Smc n=1 Tax=Acetobacterium fimetarium TaxID=52691 RepID=A0ABR6WR70_9FIRM|nr:chromosome segregation protein SMC [Acetobacterium fimetarium]MBC3803127.1 chromosome segregation protein SMC [Acetobacterium fimetarium]